MEKVVSKTGQPRPPVFSPPKRPTVIPSSFPRKRGAVGIYRNCLLLSWQKNARRRIYSRGFGPLPSGPGVKCMSVSFRLRYENEKAMISMVPANSFRARTRVDTLLRDVRAVCMCTHAHGFLLDGYYTLALRPTTRLITAADTRLCTSRDTSAVHVPHALLVK